MWKEAALGALEQNLLLSLLSRRAFLAGTSAHICWLMAFLLCSLSRASAAAPARGLSLCHTGTVVGATVKS